MSKWVFQIPSKQVGRDIHDNLQIRSALLPLVWRGEVEPGCHHLRIKAITAAGRVQRWVKTPQNILSFWRYLSLDWALLHCYNLWLLSRAPIGYGWLFYVSMGKWASHAKCISKKWTTELFDNSSGSNTLICALFSVGYTLMRNFLKNES